MDVLLWFLFLLLFLFLSFFSLFFFFDNDVNKHAMQKGSRHIRRKKGV